MKGVGWQLFRAHARGNLALAAMATACLALVGGCVNVLVGAAGIGTDPNSLHAIDMADLSALASSLMGWTLGITVFTGIFLIASVTAFTVDARIPELARLRLLGATDRQVSRSVTLETVGVALAAGLVAFPLSWPAGAVMQSLLAKVGYSPAGLDVAPPWWTVLVLPAVGVCVAYLGVRGSARRAGRTDPLIAVADITPTRRVMTVGRWVIAGVALACLVPLLLVKPDADGNYITATIGIDLVVIVALAALAPLLIPAVTRLVGGPIAAALPGTGTLAVEHARFAARRTAALAVPVLLVVGLAGGMLATIWSANNADRATSTRADLVVSAPGATSSVAVPGDAASNAPDANTIRSALTGAGLTGSVVTQTQVRVSAREQGETTTSWYLTALDASAAADDGLITVRQGSLDPDDPNALVSANADVMPLGATLTVDPPGKEPVTLTVTAVVDTDPVVDASLLVNPTLAASWGVDWVEQALIVLDAPGSGSGADSGSASGAATPEQADAARTALAAALPDATVKTGRQSLADDAAAQNRDNLQAVGALVGGGAALGACAIVLTCLSGAADRRRELLVLTRAGATGRQVVGSALLESTLVLVVATALVAVDIGFVASRLATYCTAMGGGEPIIPVAGILAILAAAGVLAWTSTALGTWWQLRRTAP